VAGFGTFAGVHCKVPSGGSRSESVSKGVPLQPVPLQRPHHALIHKKSFWRVAASPAFPILSDAALSRNTTDIGGAGGSAVV